MNKPRGPRRVMFSRRLPADLVERLRRYAEMLTPRTTDTRVVELALAEYLDQHEPKQTKGKR